jgi:hypothetical protein
MSSVLGPAWAEPSQLAAQPRYPLRVEGHVGRVVERLVRGVITTTFQARAYPLHALVWAEVSKRDLALDEALELMRRCEVVVAGISAAHQDAHVRDVPGAHGIDRVRASMTKLGYLDVAGLSKPNTSASYAQGRWGFSGIYSSPESLLGILESGRPPRPGPRLVDSQAAVREPLGQVLELVPADSLAMSTLAEHADLCVCGCASSSDGRWLSEILCRPPESAPLRNADDARRHTIQLLARVIERHPEWQPIESFRRDIGFGDFTVTDPLARSLEITQAWRGVVLRNYSVGAWRRLWSWLVDQIDEQATVAELGAALAAELGSGTVGDLISELPQSSTPDGLLLPVEANLRGAHYGPNPRAELQILLVGTRRLTELDGHAIHAYAPRATDDDLNPPWVASWFLSDPSRSLNQMAHDLTDYLVARALRIGLQKMEIRNGRPWIPSRLRERDGLFYREAPEGWGDVALRVDVLANVLAGAGIFDRGGDVWRVTEEGAALLAT